MYFFVTFIIIFMLRDKGKRQSKKCRLLVELFVVS